MSAHMTTQEGTANYIIRLYRPEDEEEGLSLLATCLSTSANLWRSPEVWRWKHYQNPFGPSYVLIAQADTGAVVGLRALMRWRLSVHSETISAMRPVDTATHPHYRRIGIFGNLIRHVLQQLQAEDPCLLFNTPNSLSLSGYLKMGWSSLGPLHPQVKIVNLPRSLPRFALSAIGRRLGKPLETGSVSTNLPPVHDLLKQSSVENLLQQNAQWNCHRLRTKQSLAYLRWRYEEHPSLPYHTLWEEDRGQMGGCLVVRPHLRDGVRGLVIDELLLAKPDTALAAELIHEAVRLSSADFLVAYFSPASFQSDVLRRNGFRRDLRRKINLVVRTLGQPLARDPRRIDSWGLSMGDLEFF